ncbi:MAG: phosphoglucose isomerase [Bacteriovoracaceae bacterium]|nr:phosphoglucose isomerase [Bacteriovoracaceae bacterium]
MHLKILPDISHPEKKSFKALHPMFTYDVPPTPPDIKEKFAKAQNFVVIGIGGSTIPLKVFLDVAELNDHVHIVETVDSCRWKKVKHLKDVLFCVVSKSGETLEIKTLLGELVTEKLLDRTIAITDPAKGSLRKFASENKIPTLDIPSDIGGRFTNFTPFHRALLERFGIRFTDLMEHAKKVSESLKKDSSILEKLFIQTFKSSKENLILWAYGERFAGLASWVQQVVAESLGKKTNAGKRVGIFPIVLKGPEDQHSVLQLLMDGPQRNAFWFFVPDSSDGQVKRNLPEPLKELNRLSMDQILNVLAESTIKTFEERLGHSETLQPLSVFTLRGMEDVVEAITVVQAFIEYAGEKLEVSAFDQPGVERGKQIAREIIKKLSS